MHMGTRLERNCPVHTRRKKILMIFVGVPPFREVGSGNDFLLFTDRRMSARWMVDLRNVRGTLFVLAEEQGQPRLGSSSGLLS